MIHTPVCTGCPSGDQWRQLLGHALPTDEAERLQRHLEHCAACRRDWQALQTSLAPSWTDQATQETGLLGQRISSAPTVPPSADPRQRFPFLGAPLGDGEIGWLGNYRVLGILGEGGMGVVFDAEDSSLRRRVALKVMKPEMAANLIFRQRFLYEARAAAALSSDHVITIYQVGMVEDVPFLAMQLLQGEALEARLHRDGRLPWRDAVDIARQVAEGLAVAHEHDLIHRDVKPANIWLEQVPGEAGDSPHHPRVKLLDFGLARAASTPTNLTASGVIVGTPQYLAPEQARGQPLDGRCDLFSLGTVLYRLLTGQFPFQGEDMMALLTALAVDEPIRVEELAPDTPPALAALVHQMLAKKPLERPATARAVVERLQAVADGTAPAVVAPAPPPRGGRRRRWLVPVLGSILLALGAGLALLWGGKKAPATNPPPAGEPIKVGVLFSLSGTLATSGGSVTDATLLAIDELNERGGVLGRPVQPVVVDGASDSREFARLAEQLITRDKVCAVFGCWTSAGRRTLRPIFEKHDHLLFYPVQYEGMEQSPNIVYLGATPNQQILPALRYAVEKLGKRRLFLVGSDYVFPHCANALIRQTLAGDRRVRVVGEAYLPLGGGEEAAVVKAILGSGADLIVNTINGDTNTLFFRALRRAGVTPERVPTLSFSVGENELRGLDVRAMVGDYAAWNYFQSIDRPQNAALVREFRDRYGPQRVLSDPMESAYTAVHLWAQAVTSAHSTQPAAVRRALRGSSYDAPGGPVRIDPDNQHTWKVARVGRIVPGGQFEVVWSSEQPIRPEPYPPLPSGAGSRAYWDDFLDGLRRGWAGHWESPHH